MEKLQNNIKSSSEGHDPDSKLCWFNICQCLANAYIIGPLLANIGSCLIGPIGIYPRQKRCCAALNKPSLKLGSHFST